MVSQNMNVCVLVTFQRLNSTPSKLPSTDSQSKCQAEAEPVSQPSKKVQQKLFLSKTCKQGVDCNFPNIFT